MRLKNWLEIIGLATALATLFGVFGILMDVFMHGQYYNPTADIFIKEPQMYILIIEIILVAISIPIMVYLGIKNIQSLATITKDTKQRTEIEKKTSKIFITSIFIGFTLTLIIGLIIYIDELTYKQSLLKYEIKKMNKTIDDIDSIMNKMNHTIYDMTLELQAKDTTIENLTIENKQLNGGGG